MAIKTVSQDLRKKMTLILSLKQKVNKKKIFLVKTNNHFTNKINNQNSRKRIIMIIYLMKIMILKIRRKVFIKNNNFLIYRIQFLKKILQLTWIILNIRTATTMFSFIFLCLQAYFISSFYSNNGKLNLKIFLLILQN